MRQFSHGGTFSSLVYGLPAIRMLGGGRLWLHPTPDGAMPTADAAAQIVPLLEAQEYVESAAFSPQPLGLSLDDVRAHLVSGYNLTDSYSRWLGLPYWPRERPWLRAESKPVARVVVARSLRHRNGDFPWGRVLGQYGADVAFVGTPNERRDFIDRHGPVGYYPCGNLLEVAQVIAGCELFVGNQSCPRAIAEGLKVPVVQETDPLDDTCHWLRPRTWYGYRPCVHLPDLGPKPPLSDLLVRLNGVRTGLSEVADRGHTMGVLLDEMGARFAAPRVVELGSVRHADDWTGGMFTLVVGTFLEGERGAIDSVDCDRATVAAARGVTAGLGRVRVVEGDSVGYLEARAEPIDVLYLDTLDDPRQAVAEFEAGRRLLHGDSLVVVDDTVERDVGWHGKGAILVPRLLAEGWQVLASGYQIVLSRAGRTPASPRPLPDEFPPELAAEQERYLQGHRRARRDGGLRHLSGLLRAVYEGCGDPELRHLVLEAVWVARRMEDVHLCGRPP